MMATQRYTPDETENFTQHYQSTLGRIVSRFEARTLLVPGYQREFCWTKEKVHQWGLSILSGDLGYGTIAVYTLPNTGRLLWLCDGYQRISATIRVRDDPERYGLGEYKEEIREILPDLVINVQKRRLQSHDQGLVLFQNLNQGTAAHPMEYYRGLITKFAQADGLIDDVVAVIEACQKVICRPDRNPGRDKVLGLKRGCIALFYQYASGTSNKDFWSYMSNKISTKNGPVEKLLAQWIDGKTEGEIKQEIKSFARFVEGTTQEIRTIVNEIKGHNEGMVNALYRCILHLAIWKRNTKQSGRSYEKLVRSAIKHSDGLTARIGLRHGEDIEIVVMGMPSFSGWRKIARFENIDLNSKRKRRPTTLPGIKHSHKIPFSENGEGETFLEPGPPNLRRGAAPIE